MQKNSLALYKNQPALVVNIGDKLEISLPGGKTVKVRPKDVQVLHPGPLSNLSSLMPQSGDIETAWELLAGETTTLADLAELIYDAFTPATAWATWQLVSAGLYFHGTPQAVTVRTEAEVAHKQQAQQAKAAEAEAWGAFVKRVQAGKTEPDDARYLQDVEKLAYGQQEKSRLLRTLGRGETPENAHTLLLKLGVWPPILNPYPRRLGVAMTQPNAPLPDLPAEDRRDLTHLTALAIDDEGSKDPDDAISLEPGRLWVHIADVAALVYLNSPADLEAGVRAANLYLPEGTIHMLPHRATEILGLGLNKKSPALSFGLDLNERYEVISLEIVPSWISVTRLSYAEAENRLNEEPFSSLYRLAEMLQARRIAYGAIELDLPEVKVRVIDGEIIIRPLPALLSRNLVREAMLACGEAVALFAQENNIPIPYSVQEPPAPLDEDLPEGMAGMFALRRTLKRSELKNIPAPHTGLGLPCYTQATSPLRRYADLLAHQQLRSFLHGGSPLSSQALLERLGAAETMRGAVRRAERLSNKHWTLLYLQQRSGWQGEGILLEMRGSRGLVLIPTLDLETRLHFRNEAPLNSKFELMLNGINLPELEAYFKRVSGKFDEL